MGVGGYKAWESRKQSIAKKKCPRSRGKVVECMRYESEEENIPGGKD